MSLRNVLKGATHRVVYFHGQKILHFSFLFSHQASVANHKTSGKSLETISLR
jgi:hypothetical protein